jgi:hypothetical protein
MDPIAFNLMHGRLIFRYNPVKRKVFVVHGRNHDVRDTVTRFLFELGLEAIVLDEQASRGRTIIEKFEHHSKGVLLALAVLLPTTSDILRISQARRNREPDKILSLSWVFLLASSVARKS